MLKAFLNYYDHDTGIAEVTIKDGVVVKFLFQEENKEGRHLKNMHVNGQQEISIFPLEYIDEDHALRFGINMTVMFDELPRPYYSGFMATLISLTW